ncbi:MAG: hypothetical protein AAFV69_13860 [Pseudomonadota bacterium]
MNFRFSLLILGLLVFVSTLLIAIPFLGILLIQAPFLHPLFLVSLLFLVFGVEALSSHQYRFLAIVPIIWFGGHTVLLASSWMAHRQLGDEIENFNKGKTIGYTLGNVDVVVVPSGGINATGKLLSSNTARMFVSDYGLNVSFVKNKNAGTTSHLSYRVADIKNCRSARKRLRGLTWTHKVRTNQSGRRPFSYRDDICIVRLSENPKRSRLVISAQTTTKQNLLLPHDIHIISIARTGFPTIVIKTASTQPISWVPGLSIIRCFFKSRTCGRSHHGPKRYHLIADTSGHWYLSRALKLKKNTVSPIQKTISGNSQLVTKLETDRERFALANLKALIDDPFLKYDAKRFDLQGLNEKRELWRSEVRAMLRAVNRVLSGSGDGRDASRSLTGLLATLDPRTWRQNKLDFLRLIERNHHIANHKYHRAVTFFDAKFVTRLGEFGPEALPAIRILGNWETIGPPIPVILAACKMGAAAKTFASKLLTILQTGDRDRAFASFVALVRMSRKDLANQAMANGPFRHAYPFSDAAALLTVNAPADACVPRYRWRQFSRK